MGCRLRERYNLPSDKGHVTLHFLSRESCFIVFSDHKENLEHKASLQKQRVLDNDWTFTSILGIKEKEQCIAADWSTGMRMKILLSVIIRERLYIEPLLSGTETVPVFIYKYRLITV